jgi:hypothetical protein
LGEQRLPADLEAALQLLDAACCCQVAGVRSDESRVQAAGLPGVAGQRFRAGSVADLAPVLVPPRRESCTPLHLPGTG